MTDKLKVFEMFAGYGGASFALKKAAISHEVVGFSEIDKYAIQCYEQNHNGKNYSDAIKINEKELPNFDLLTGGFPCQAFSVAGKGLGELDTRGTLFNEIIRIAEHKQPKYMLLENVKGLMGKKHETTFNKILSELKRIGYITYYQVLNSRKFGIPQNRERVFFVCIRKNVFDYKNFFHYPNEKELNLCLNDILEDKVDEKYFLSDKTIAKLTRHNNKIITNPKNPIYSACIHANYFKMGGRDQQYIIDGSRKRKFTPKECFRLMGFVNDEINVEGLSDTQKYKLAGNGWEINLVSNIMHALLKEYINCPRYREGLPCHLKKAEQTKGQ